jgi:hypothetical protein
MVTLAPQDSFSFMWDTNVIVTRDGFITAPTYLAGQVAVFSRSGQLHATFGRAGQGPGELSSDVLLLSPGPGDTIHVVDYSRWLVFAPGSFAFVRSVNLGIEPTSFTIVDSGGNRGDMIAAYPSRVATGVLHAVHLISARTGTVIRSFDAPPPDELRDALDSSRSIGWYDGAVWSSARNRVRVRMELLDGSRSVEWFRSAGWFPGSGQERLGAPFIERPQPKAWSVIPGAEVLWVHATVADEHWKPAAKSLSDPALREVIRTADMNRFYDSIIELIDRRSGTVVAALRNDAILAPVHGDSSLVHRKIVTDQGDIVIQILRISLQR